MNWNMRYRFWLGLIFAKVQRYQRRNPLVPQVYNTSKLRAHLHRAMSNTRKESAS